MQRGAANDAGVLTFMNREDLVVKDSQGKVVGGEFCGLWYSPELAEGLIDVCAIHHEEYHQRFPEQCFKYWGIKPE